MVAFTGAPDRQTKDRCAMDYFNARNGRLYAEEVDLTAVAAEYGISYLTD